jgi:arylformamidase
MPAANLGAPLLVFVHGGYWRRLSADDGCLLSEGAHAQGWAFASVNYTLCPNGPLDLLVDQTRRAIDSLISDAPSLGHDAHRVVIAGHSAGGHLAGMVSLTDPRPAGYVMVSGVFDITPIVHTPINDDVRLTPEDAARLSPMMQMVPRPGVPCLVTWGDQETSEFRRQSLEWTERWSTLSGAGTATAVAARDRHHFDVVYDLVDPGTEVGAAVTAMMR